ncbi:MAG: HAD hydrolase family protein [Nocardioidaceae bacterium]
MESAPSESLEMVRMAVMTRVVATDLDGTLTSDGHVADETLAALAEVREAGLTTILVTGRIGSELDREFPGLRDCFDAVVTENGALVETSEAEIPIAGGFDRELAQSLADAGVEFRTGRSVIDCHASDASRISSLIIGLGVDAQLVRNRERLMVLPAGVSKGGGLLAATRELGLSCHNVLAIGDAENDLSLLEAAEIGVAVANAVPSLRSRADVVLEQPDGAGIVELLQGPLVRGGQRLLTARRTVRVGTFADGKAVLVPSAWANILIRGESGAGKSHLAGLLVEGWVRAGYTVLVIDMEGDYHGLGHLPDVVVLDDEVPPTHSELVALLRQRSISVVLDLSPLPAGAAGDYLAQLGAVLEAERAGWGLPHWVVLDEAHGAVSTGGALEGLLSLGDYGYCVVTFRPGDLAEGVLGSMDVVITATGRAPDLSGTALLHGPGGVDRPFTLSPRHTPHVRHWHKYVTAPLAREHWFEFVDTDGQPVGSAENMASFLHQLRTLSPEVIGRHLAHRDVSRWLVGSLKDRQLGAMAAAIEQDVLTQQVLAMERARTRLVAAVEAMYGDHPAAT